MQQAHSRRVSALAMRKISYLVEAKQSNDDVAFLEAGAQEETIASSHLWSLLLCVTGSAYSSPLLNVTFSGDNGQLSSYYGSLVNDLSHAAADCEAFR